MCLPLIVPCLNLANYRASLRELTWPPLDKTGTFHAEGVREHSGLEWLQEVITVFPLTFC